MKIIDRNGRLFGKISIIDLLVIAVVIVMAAALHFKSNQTHTGVSVTEEPITFQIRAQGVRTYVADAIRIGDSIYDQAYPSGGRPLGRITDIQIVRDPGTTIAYPLDGSIIMADMEDSLDLMVTVEGSGLIDGKNYYINRVYELGMNSSRTYYTKICQFIGSVAGIG